MIRRRIRRRTKNLKREKKIFKSGQKKSYKCKCTKYLPNSQLVPVYPAKQAHVYPEAVGPHIPLTPHGLLAQTSITAT